MKNIEVQYVNQRYKKDRFNGGMMFILKTCLGFVLLLSALCSYSWITM